MARIAHVKCCIICGCEVRRFMPNYANEKVTWMNKYRILYRHGHDGVTGLSGVSCHHDARGGYWYAPWSYNDTGIYTGRENLPQRDLICVMEAPPFGLRYGFVTHDACWSLLEKVYSPHHIPYETLFNTCKSLEGQEPRRILDWGHEYGGAAWIDWNDRVAGRSIDDARNPPVYFYQGPSACREQVEGLVQERPQIPVPAVETFSPPESSTDCFHHLPIDLRLIIVDLLEIPDCWNLRLASKAFYFLFNEGSFWARRFLPGNERDWLFEVSEIHRPNDIDWRSLYKVTSDPERLAPRLRNRARVWNLAKLVKNAVPTNTITSFQHPAEFGPAAKFDVWRTIHGHNGWPLNTPRMSSDDEDNLPSSPPVVPVRLEQTIQLPGSLEELRVYFIQLGPYFFISGITFHMNSNRSRHMGYKSGSVERLKLKEHPVGFNVALAPQGLLAMQAVYTDGQSSHWVGRNLDMPKSRRLVVHDKITAVKGIFDGCKLVALSVSRRPPTSTSEREAMDKLKSSLFHSAIWYPELPDVDTHLNEESGVIPIHVLSGGQYDAREDYVPIYYMRFGGKGGRYLHSLSRIQGTLHTAVSFHYDDRPMALWGTEQAYSIPEEPSFSIDGKGGERIVSVQTTMEDTRSDKTQNLMRWGELVSVTLSTNRGREYKLFDFLPQYGKEVLSANMEIAPGTEITGIYGITGGTFLGIASEPIRANTNEATGHHFQK